MCAMLDTEAVRKPAWDLRTVGEASSHNPDNLRSEAPWFSLPKQARYRTAPHPVVIRLPAYTQAGGRWELFERRPEVLRADRDCG
jgi:hypothetical protein